MPSVCAKAPKSHGLSNHPIKLDNGVSLRAISQCLVREYCKIKKILAENPEAINTACKRPCLTPLEAATKQQHTHVIFFLLQECSPKAKIGCPGKGKNAFGYALEHYLNDDAVIGLFIERAKEEKLGSRELIYQIVDNASCFEIEKIEPFTTWIIDQFGTHPGSLFSVMADLDFHDIDYIGDGGDTKPTIQRLLRLWDLLVSYRNVSSFRAEDGSTQSHLACQYLPPKYKELLKDLNNPFARDLDGDKPKDLARVHGSLRTIGPRGKVKRRKDPENAERLAETVARLEDSCDIDRLIGSVRVDDDNLGLAECSVQRHSYDEALGYLARVQGPHRILADALSATIVWRTQRPGSFEAAMTFLEKAFDAAKRLDAVRLYASIGDELLNDDPETAQQGFKEALRYESRKHDRKKLEFHYDIASFEILLKHRHWKGCAKLPFELRDNVASMLLAAYQQEMEPWTLVVRREDAPDKRFSGPLIAVGNV
ncbi:MAG: hypothetical protein Q9207_004509 [Kuettlingeria erythrocarpa]